MQKHLRSLYDSRTSCKNNLQKKKKNVDHNKLRIAFFCDEAFEAEKRTRNPNRSWYKRIGKYYLF